ncbi:hypothetical protein EVAR_103844_1 [Eumeta japonica]|uniref:Uncharacterized protein n=1 Tax=Eumeta variegata TaxID=151549 RepID=A0A4C2A8Z3_EUMVA|nr:hypothetical protein EVAR_103844_1 [Eumeta japonica]
MDEEEGAQVFTPRHSINRTPPSGLSTVREDLLEGTQLLGMDKTEKRPRESPAEEVPRCGQRLLLSGDLSARLLDLHYQKQES